MPNVDEVATREKRMIDGKRYCSLVEFDCEHRHYARGLCKSHYIQVRDGKPLAKLLSAYKVRDCTFPGCENQSVARRGNPLCRGHHSQAYRGVELFELTPYFQGYSDDFSERTCKDCKETKPIDEFYERNQALGRETKSTKCKACFIMDSAYYRGLRTTKANGTDPLGWQSNPHAQEQRRLGVNSKKVKVLSAQFPDYCRYCHEQISVGELLIWVKRDDLYHYGECYMKSQQLKKK